MIWFDLDGTLTDSNGIWEDIDLQFLGRRGLTPTEEYAHTVGHSIFPIAAQFTRDYYKLNMTAGEIMAEWTAEAREGYAHVPLKAGAGALLAQYAQAGEDMALVTACVPELCRIALSCHGLEGYFRDVVFAQELGLEKRNPEFYRLTGKRLGVALKDCVFFEDAPANCAVAKTLGITVVGVYDQFYAKYEAEMRESCDKYVYSLEELLV